jgi:hypothetical protein
MPTPGLVNPNIRLPSFPEPELPDVIIEAGEDVPDVETNGDILRIEHDDGSVTVSLDGKPIDGPRSKVDGGWFENIVEDIDSTELYRIADTLLRGIEDDIQSRKEWIEDRATGIGLLGLKMEIPGISGTGDGAPVEGMSKVRHPLLLEAVLRFQANARSELLPTDGPVKVRNDNNNANLEQDQLARSLERDLNHYLTDTASEYYPDTDRMLLMLGFGGTAFKKVNYCPLRNRPVSETVDADDLIVSNSATDLRNAKRITHRTYLRPSTVKRLQLLGAYRDVDLSQPKAANLDSAQRAERAAQGVADMASNPEDRDREIYECYCELDIKGFEHKWKGKETGLEIPYRVTIDVSTREVLSVVRNYEETEQELPETRMNFVKYTFVPGFGFYDIGLLHILGNTTNAVTAGWREMLDAGMFANFPGFLMADTGARQNTNIFRVPPGGGALVKTGGMPLNQAIMPLPYKEPGQAMMNLIQNMVETGQRVGGTAEVAVGEGRADAPVGTTLALIDQATKVMNSVHKRMHAAQAEEFKLLVRCFKENPESFWRCKNKASYPWDEQTFLKALADCDLVPQADPNTASQTQRMMKIMGLKQLQQASPSLYDPIAIDTAALQAMGWSNPQQFMVPPASLQQKDPPEVEYAKAKLAIEKQKADADTMRAQADVQKTMSEVGGQTGAEMDPLKVAELQMKGQEMAMKQEAAAQNAQATELEMAMKRQELGVDSQNRERERESRERLAAVRLAQDIAKNPAGLPIIQGMLDPGMLQRLQSNEPPLTEQ